MSNLLLTPLPLMIFAKIDMRVAKVLKCEAVPESNKLLRFELDLGDHTRQVFSGIKAAYNKPEELEGRFCYCGCKPCTA